eukprot:CAMPEP_0198295332 /NCGR_PEP_ID=MMETSP1449-20131203/27277_1 /TAXON_ID=420275 /ORGANISM="Attheya septentrionalis, Strain CCMP2084" /LENGTH=188 /DNA_ID=CAMNT_0043995613 /DNA_START=35 /DNA_END=599 /DNA_ORIENTATION=-
MGMIISQLWDRLASKQEMRLLMLGLDAAGKTSTLYKLKLGENVTTIPTIGFNVETIQYKNITMTVWDIGGQDKIRPLWRHYFQGTQALIYVVDSNDTERIEEARLSLHSVLSADELQDVVLLVFANKQDLPHAMCPSEITEKLALPVSGGSGSFKVAVPRLAMGFTKVWIGCPAPLLKELVEFKLCES